MTWYEAFIMILIVCNLIGIVYCLWVERKSVKKNNITKSYMIRRILLQGLFLVAFYDALAISAWITSDMVTKVSGVPLYLYVIAETFKNAYFLAIIIWAILLIRKYKNNNC